MKIRIETPLDSEEDEIVIRCRKLDSRIMTVIEAYNRESKELYGYKGNTAELLSCEDIYYFESVDNKVYAYARSEVYEIKHKLYEIEELYQFSNLLRCSKSMILNISKIKCVTPLFNGRMEAHLKNDEKIIISRQYVSSLKKKIGIAEE
ncbi:MAG: LytTR family DNA-binding domain-containing protein [Oscillospiraceae bacterium]|nr:LytTR family DNA-binding domain-containing protein [Oscillospiraceae bacterium]